MSSPIHAALESDPAGVSMAHILALPGCITLEPSPDAALAALPAAVRDYAAWLTRHGEAPDFDAEARIEVVERVPRGAYGSGGEMTLFAADRERADDAHIARILRLLEYSRADLLAAWQAIPAAARERAPAAGGRSPLGIIEHVRNADWWYLNRLRQDLTEPNYDPDIQVHQHVFRVELHGRFEPVTLFAALAAIRAWLHDELPHLTEAERTHIFPPSRFPTDNPAEQWTARKALRRMLEHEREHTANLRQRLAQYRHEVESAPPAAPIGWWLVRLADAPS